MELIGKLKQKAENAAGKEEVRELIEQAGVKLTDEELEQVSGGYERLVVKDIEHSNARETRDVPSLSAGTL